MKSYKNFRYYSFNHSFGNLHEYSFLASSIHCFSEWIERWQMKKFINLFTQNIYIFSFIHWFIHFVHKTFFTRIFTYFSILEFSHKFIHWFIYQDQKIQKSAYEQGKILMHKQMNKWMNGKKTSFIEKNLSFLRNFWKYPCTSIGRYPYIDVPYAHKTHKEQNWVGYSIFRP